MIVSPLSPARSLRALIRSSSARPPRGRRCGSGQPLSADGTLLATASSVSRIVVLAVDRLLELSGMLVCSDESPDCRFETTVAADDADHPHPDGDSTVLPLISPLAASRSFTACDTCSPFYASRSDIRRPPVAAAWAQQVTTHSEQTSMLPLGPASVARLLSRISRSVCSRLHAPLRQAIAPCRCPRMALRRPRLERHVRYAHTQYSEQIAPSPAHGRAAGTRPGRRGEGPLRRLRMGARLERIAAARGWPGRPDAGSRGRPNSGRGRAMAH